MATVKLDPAKGVQIPNKTTTERNAISSPETGALIWNTTTSAINQYNGSAWEATDTNTQADITGKLNLSGGAMTGTITGFTSTGIDDNATSTAITIDASENVGIGTTTPGADGSESPMLDIADYANGGKANAYMRLTGSTNAAYGSESYYTGHYRDTGNSEFATVAMIGMASARTGASNIGGKLNFYTKDDGGANTAAPTVKMSIDATGRVTMPLQPAFSAYLSGNQSIAQSVTTLVTLDTDEFDIGNNFNTSTNRFVAPVAGRYLFTAGLQFLASTTVTAHTNLYINGGARTNGWFDFADSKASTQSRVLDLAANDYVQLFAHSVPASTLSAERCKLTGFLIG